MLGVLLTGVAVPARATILTFDIFDPAYSSTENYPEGYGVNPEYGDRVTTSSSPFGTTTFEYGVGAEGFTPNVVVEYGPFSIFTGGPSLWRYDYGDLTRVLYQGSTFTGIGNDYDFLQIVLRADAGFEAVLHGFDLGGWNQTDRTVNAVSVYNADYSGFDPTLNRVFHDANATILGAGPSSSTYTFPTPLRGNVITIFIESTNLGADSELIGIDNIRFGQDTASDVPEPGTAALVAAALVGLAARRIRQAR